MIFSKNFISEVISGLTATDQNASTPKIVFEINVNEICKNVKRARC